MKSPTRVGWWVTPVLIATLTTQAVGADFFERLGFGKKKSSDTTAEAGSQPDLSGLTEAQVVAGLKEALGKGVEASVARLGKQDGFLKDVAVRIPMPEKLQKVERVLRTARQDGLADEFVTTMNRAAEKAVPQAAAVLADALKQMTLTDAKAILVGTNNAATEYFRRTSETNLQARFLPIVREATEQAGVTRVYKQMLEKAKGGTFGNFGSVGADLLGAGDAGMDLDAYVTRKSLDGLFVKIAEEEKRVRESAASRTTDLLQKVFGALGKPTSKP